MHTVVNYFIKKSLSNWLSKILSKSLSFDDLWKDTVLLNLIELTYNDDLNAMKFDTSCEKIEFFLNGMFNLVIIFEAIFQDNPVHLFDIQNITNGKSTDCELVTFSQDAPLGSFKETVTYDEVLYLTVLLGCLQSDSRQNFMDAALQLDVFSQNIIFHLIREPMLKFCGQTVVIRELILKNINEVNVELSDEFKSATEKRNETEKNSRDNGFDITTGNCKTTGFKLENVTEHNDYINHNDDNYIYHKKNDHLSCDLKSSVESLKKSLSAGDSTGSRPTHLPLNLDIKEHDHHLDESNQKHQTQLEQTNLFNNNFNTLTNNNDTHTSEECVSRRLFMPPPPLASPLTSLKQMMNSPLWNYKNQARELERENRRLLSELSKERSNREEAESIVAGLRNQAQDAKSRLVEAEARALRLSRELDALHDQSDELTECRAELVLKEENIADLKQRLNGVQDLIIHSRKLKVENENLHQQCEDYRLKINETLNQMKELKDRRILCSEVEELRSKLHDMEARLAQELIEREALEKDRRLQKEIYDQLKIQNSLNCKRLAAKNSRKLSKTKASKVETELAGQPLATDRRDAEDSDSDSTLVKMNGQILEVCGSSTPETPNRSFSDLFLPKVGENLGAVLEHDYKTAKLHIDKLKSELHSSQLALSHAQSDVDHLTKQMDQLNTDLTSTNAKHQSTSQSLNVIKDDLVTLQHRFECFHANLVNTCDDDADDVLCGYSKTMDLVTHQLVSLPSGLTSEGLLSLSALLGRYFTLVIDQSNSYCRQLKGQLDSIRQLYNSQMLGDSERQLLTNQLDILKCENGQLNSHIATLVDRHEQALMESETTIKTQFDKELTTARELLEDKVKRLQEFEKLADQYSSRPAQVAAICQTDDNQTPALQPDSDISEPSDLKANPCLDDSYQATSADRRGLSDELLRLHEELAQSNVCCRNLEQEVTELHEQIVTLEVDVERQRVLANRAQQNWVVVERKYRQSEDELAKLRRVVDESGGGSLSNHISNGHVGNQHQSLQELMDIQFRLSKTDEDRSQLLDENWKLKRELDRLQQRSLIVRTSSPNRGRRYSADVENASFVRPSARYSHRHHNHHHRHHQQQPHYGGGSRKHKTDAAHLDKLFSRAIQLEQFAMDMGKNNNHNQSYQFATCAELHGNSLTQPKISNQYNNSHYCHTDKMNSAPASAPIMPRIDRSFSSDDLDTDADSSAYTNLSQISSVAPNSNTSALHNYGHKSNRQDNGHVISGVQNEHVYTAKQNDQVVGYVLTQPIPHYTRQRLSSPANTDPNRIVELHLRNRLQPKHLRSSYPVETQVFDSNKLPDAFGPIMSLDSASHRDYTARSTSSNGKVLQEKDDLINSNSNQQLADDGLPMAAGYCPIPRQLDSIAEAFISATNDPKDMMPVMTARLGRSGKLMKVADVEGGRTQNPPMNSVFANPRPNGIIHSSSDVDHQDLSNDENLNPPANQRRNCQSNMYPTSYETDSFNFVQPHNLPPHHLSKQKQAPRTQVDLPSCGAALKHLVPGEDVLAENVRNNKMSCAFEILNDDISHIQNGIRRLPPRTNQAKTKKCSKPTAVAVRK